MTKPRRTLPAHHPDVIKHRSSRERVEYHPNKLHERQDHEECQHYQYLDKEWPNTGVCLDCGHEIYIGHSDPAVAAGLEPWSKVPDGKLLSKDELIAHRQKFARIWWPERNGHEPGYEPPVSG